MYDALVATSSSNIFLEVVNTIATPIIFTKDTTIFFGENLRYTGSTWVPGCDSTYNIKLYPNFAYTNYQ